MTTAIRSWRRRKALALALLGAGVASAQTPAPIPPRYSADLLDCARFHESSRSDIRTEMGGRTRDASAVRQGVWQFRARDTTGGIALVGWYDSLTVQHTAAGTTLEPDTDGLIGGRYRGLLVPTGAYRPLARPFVPDEVAEVTEAGAALDDLLPPLPPIPLATGQRWSDSGGVEIVRLSDSADAGKPVQRYGVRARREAEELVPRGDTVPIPVRETSSEETVLLWDPASGLRRATRNIAVDATVPAGGRVLQAVRTEIRQRITLTRLDPVPTSACR